MIKNLLFITITLFTSITINAQPILQWQKCFGGGNQEESHGLIQTSDGGYMLSAYTRSNDGNVSGNHGNGDFWMVKMDSVGLFEWQKCLGGSEMDIASSIVSTIDGGYIIVGSTNSFNGDVSCGNGLNDGWIVKTDGVGNIQWQNCAGSFGDDFIYCIQPTSDGGYILCGTAFSFCSGVANNGGADAFFVKLNASGLIEWENCLGGSSTEYAYEIQQLADGSYIAVGYTFSNNGDVSGNHLSGGNPTQDVWVVKLTASGLLDWQKCLGGTSYDIGNSIIVTSDGGYLLAGQVSTNDGDISGYHGGRDAWLVKLTANGNISWQKCMGGTQLELSGSVREVTNGGYIFIGGTQSNNGDVSGNHLDQNNQTTQDVWVTRLDVNGGFIWKKCYGGTKNEAGVNILATEAGKYTFTANTYSNNGDVSGNHDEQGNFLDCWVVRLGTLITGEEDLFVNPSISVFPNPSSGIFSLSSNIAVHDVDLEIVNMLGQQVYNEKMKSFTQHQLDISFLPEGNYFLNLRGKEMNTVRRIVIE